MALTITKQTGGAFFFEPTSGGTSTHKTVTYFDRNGVLSFYDAHSNLIETVGFADLTVNDGTDDFTFVSGKEAVDKLVDLGL